MNYKVEDIKRDIRIALDQNKSSEALEELGDVDTLTVEEIIENRLVPAVRVVLLNAPLALLGGGIPLKCNINWHSAPGQGSGSVLLPNDFLRLVTFQMSDWSRAVYSAITPDNPAYAMQKSRFPGIRGNTQNPVVAIVNTGVGMELEFYSCSGGSGVSTKQATYIPEPRIIGDSIHIPHKVKEAVVYYAAYLVALALQQKDLSEQLNNISISLLKP